MSLDQNRAAPGPKPRILFVDDEQQLLDGLRLVLHKQRRRWDLAFALGGAAALGELARHPIDIVVTDVRMQDMDGAALLTLIQDLYPGTHRLVLSGHCDEATARRASRVAHRWLAKPCEPAQIVAAIERSLATRDLLGVPAVQRLVGRLTLLPAPSRIVVELTELLADPTCDADAVAEVAARDTALAARLLQLTNSAYFSPARAIEDVRDAVMMLGFVTMAQLIVESELVGRAAHGLSTETLVALNRRARLVARSAELILHGRPDARTAALGGLLSGVGHLAFAQSAPQLFDDLYHDIGAEEPLEVLEERTFGVRPELAGAALLGLWGLPPRVVETVLHHRMLHAARPTELDAVVALHVASALVSETLDQRRAVPLDRSSLQSLGLEGQLDGWRRAIAGVLVQDRRRQEARRAS